MSKLEALTELAAKVEAGECPMWTSITGGIGLNSDNRHILFYKAFHGSLDAAKALHEAVLHERGFVEIEWSKRYEEESRVTISMGKDGWVSASANPARAWLFAIIRALIAQEEAA